MHQLQLQVESATREASCAAARARAATRAHLEQDGRVHEDSTEEQIGTGLEADTAYPEVATAVDAITDAVRHVVRTESSDTSSVVQSCQRFVTE
eukprot:7948698-Karenia_brevis.AAC.1